jgi:site-specific DNA-methyltransferase (adenine-specific)
LADEQRNRTTHPQKTAIRLSRRKADNYVTDVWELLMNYPDDFIDQIICGDCLEVMKEIPDKAVDMILCDLPYGTTACKWDTVIPFEPLWTQYRRIAKWNAAIVLTASQPFTTALIASNMWEFRYCWYWKKSVGSGFQNAKRQPLRLIEEVAVFYRKPPQYIPQGLVRIDAPRVNKISAADSIVGGTSGRGGLRTVGNEWVQEFTNYPRNVLEFPAPMAGRQHPTQKPVALMEYLIRTYTNEGDLVLDNCIGSGTTAVACLELNRHFIGIELSPEYCEIAKKRIKEIQPQLVFG